MKPPAMPLSPRRVARCKAIVKGRRGRTDRAIRDHVAYLVSSRPDKFIAMLTDDAIEELAFMAMSARVSTNRFNAKSRANYAQTPLNQSD